MRQPLLIASDIDGTLIDDHHRISARNRATIGSAVAEQIPFVLVTGRPPRWLAPITEQLGIAPMAVCANGAVVYDTATDRIVSAQTLDTDTLGWLAETIARALPGAGLAAERLGDHGEDMNFAKAPAYVHPWAGPEGIDVSDAEVLAAPAVKLLVRVPAANSADLRDVLAPLVSHRVDVTFSTDDGLLEIARKGVDKAVGLATIAADLGVAPDGVIAFGDMPNDVPMLRWAGHGVAMGNAHPEVEPIADERTASNNDSGVGLVLERWWG